MDRFGQTVRLFSRRTKLTIGQIAIDAGIPEKRFRKLIDNDPLERRQASASELLSVWAVLGKAAASRDLSAVGMSAEDLDTPPEDEAGLARATAEMFAAGGELARLAVDGIDADEADAAEAAADRVEAQAEKIRRAARAARRRRR